MRLTKQILEVLTAEERRRGARLLGLMLLGMLLETFGVSLVIPAINLLMDQDVGSRYPQVRPLLAALGHPTHLQLVIGGMVTLIVIYMIKAAFLAFLAWRQFGFAFDLQARLSRQLYMTYLRQPYIFHLQRNSAELIRNATIEVAQFTSGGITPAMMIVTEGLVLVGIAALLLYVEPVGALSVVLVLGISGGLSHKATRVRITRWGRARQKHEGRRLQHLQQGLGGAKDVKLLGRESDFLEQFERDNRETARVAQLQATMKELPRLWLEVLAVMGLAVLVLSMAFRGRDMASIMPTLGLFAIAAFRLMPSLNRVLGALQSIRFGLPSIETLHRDLGLAATVPERTAADRRWSFSREIRLRNVRYSYPTAAAPALQDLSLAIHRGESVGFVGTSGAGKSTLVDVVLGLLTPSAGQVLVDDNDIQGDLRSWQDQIGYVPQSIFLTDDSLRRNVAFGLADDQIDEGAVARAIRAAQLEEFVRSLPDGLDTVVGERGVRLSGGQRQRIGIARALYHDPAVLVLDEATSALDTTTERGVMEAVSALHGTKTILIVAHRMTTVQACDRLYRLDHGVIVEEVSQYAATRGA